MKGYLCLVIQKYWRKGTRAIVRDEKSGLGWTSLLAEIRRKAGAGHSGRGIRGQAGLKDGLRHRLPALHQGCGQRFTPSRPWTWQHRLHRGLLPEAVAGDNKPLGQLLNLINRCNRSVPHMEVVTISLDVLLNISRVTSTRRTLIIASQP